MVRVSDMTQKGDVGCVERLTEGKDQLVVVLVCDYTEESCESECGEP